MSQGSSKSPDLILFPFEKSGLQISSIPRFAARLFGSNDQVPSGSL
jgi:hypothetical protein